MNDVEKTVSTSVVEAQSLTIAVGEDLYTVEAADAPITIGRVFPAQILVSDPRISRNHLRLETEGGQWVAVDHSSNGVFRDGTAVPSVVVTSGLTLHLGHPEGIAVDFKLSPPALASAGLTGSVSGEASGGVGDEDWEEDMGDTTAVNDYVDPGVARAGAAVAARRRELDIAQRALAKDKVMNAGSLIAFEKGRSWPRRSTLAKLEEVLRWEPGTISRIRFGQDFDAANAAEQTAALGNTAAPTSHMAQALKIALDAIANQIAALPALLDPDSVQRISVVLADLRKLEQVAADAARASRGATDVVGVLSGVRRQYRDLMLRAARSPHATLGQQLFAARHRAELTAEEAANAAGLPIDAVTAVEADKPVSAEATAAVRALVATLARR